MKNFQIIACLFPLLSLPVPALAQATVNETTSGIGDTVYNYSITNNGTLPLIDFNIGLDPSVPISNILAPTGWTGSIIQIGGSNAVEWFFSDPSYELQPGYALSGFSYESTPTVGGVPYSVDDENINSFPGVTQGPIPAAPIPEASTFASFGVLLFLGGIGLVARKRTRRTA